MESSSIFGFIIHLPDKTIKSTTNVPFLCLLYNEDSSCTRPERTWSGGSGCLCTSWLWWNLCTAVLKRAPRDWRHSCRPAFQETKCCTAVFLLPLTKISACLALVEDQQTVQCPWPRTVSPHRWGHMNALRLLWMKEQKYIFFVWTFSHLYLKPNCL